MDFRWPFVMFHLAHLLLLAVLSRSLLHTLAWCRLQSKSKLMQRRIIELSVLMTVFSETDDNNKTAWCCNIQSFFSYTS